MFNVFITNLGKYNEGDLVGKWVSLPMDQEEFAAELESIGVSDEPDENGNYYEEWFITDYENDIDYKVNEYASFEEINRVAESIEALDDYSLEVVKAAIEAGYACAGDEIDPDDYILYSGQDLEAVAYDLVQDCYPEVNNSILGRYFDYEQFARDLSFDGYTETSYGVIFQC